MNIIASPRDLRAHLQDVSPGASGVLPNLVIAGAPKSGTSSVFRWLADHPEVQGSSVKETYYFVDPGTHMHDPDRHFEAGGIDGYRKFFLQYGKQPRVVVEATPGYLYSALALQELPKLPTRPHFIFILREPANQIRSTFNYFRSNWDWIDSSMTFSEFIAAVDAETHEFNGNELARHALRNVNYIDFLLSWRAACGEDRLQVYLFEEVFGDCRGFMRGLAQRLGIDPGFYDSYAFPAENQTYAVRSNALQKLNIAVRALLPQGAVYTAVRKLYRSINTTRVSTEENEVDTAIDAAVAQRYADANQELAREFNLDIGLWSSIQSRRLEYLKSRGMTAHVYG
jgi:hypothetical protein